MFRKVLMLTAVVLVFSVCQVQADTVTWDGEAAPGDNGWNRAENWDSDVVPGVSDNVVINMGTEEDEEEIQLQHPDFTIDSLDISGYVGLGAWGLHWIGITITNGLVNNGILEIYTDGWIGLYADVTNTTGARLELERIDIEGIFTNEIGATVEIWDEAEFIGDLDNDGIIEVDPFSEMWVEGTLFNEGLIQLYGGNAECEGTLENDENGIIKGFGLIGADETFINSGEIIAEGGVLVLYSEGTFETTGVLSNEFVSSLQIGVVADVDNVGTMYVKSGGGIAINNDLINSSGGVIELMGGTLAARLITQKAGAYFTGFGSITCFGLSIEDGAEVELTGPTNIIGLGVSIDSGATLIISAGQTLITGQTTNNGTIVLAGGTVIFQGGYSGSGKIIDATNPNAIIIDNDHYGTSSTGIWLVSSKAGFYGTNSLYSYEVGATYTFETWAVGAREISMWWTAHSTRSTAVSIEIYDGSTLLDTVVVNQEINGSKWNILGIYSFSNKAKVKIISSGEDAAIADAVKIAPVSDVIIDNGDVGTSSTGVWSVSGKLGFYGTESLYSREVGATYSFEASLQVTSKVSMWWTAHSTRSTAVSIEIYDGSTLLETVIVNQEVDGSQWNVLGIYSFSDKAKVKVITPGDDAAIADAVKFTPL